MIDRQTSSVSLAQYLLIQAQMCILDLVEVRGNLPLLCTGG